MTTMPPGPWVLVIGCHRSGTSAVTAALVALGLHGVDPADRMDRVTSNPEHWESMAASQFNEDLLASLGAAWDAPPAADAESPLPDPVSGAEDPARIMAQAYPEPGPVVWKDPRACLLLPFWRAALPGPLAVIFVWREPLAVARSLHRRDGIPLADGLALWEHYNRCAAVGLQGVDTFVLDYSSVVDDPEKALGRACDWLRQLPQLRPWIDRWDPDAAAGAIERGLRHETAAEGDGAGGLPDDHRVLAEWLDRVAGAHAPLETMPPGPVSVWPEAVLAGRREQAAWIRTVRLAECQDELESVRARYEGTRTELDRVRASTSWKVTRPLRAVIAKLSR